MRRPRQAIGSKRSTREDHEEPGFFEIEMRLETKAELRAYARLALASVLRGVRVRSSAYRAKR